MSYRILTVPFSDVEILSLDDEVGAIYNPKVFQPPTPWHRKCRHCQAGGDGLSTGTMKALEFMCRRTTDVFRFREFSLVENANGIVIVGSEPVVVSRQLKVLVGSPKILQNRGLMKAVRLLASSRPATPAEVRACNPFASPTSSTRPPTNKPTGVCKAFPWPSTL